MNGGISKLFSPSKFIADKTGIKMLAPAAVISDKVGGPGSLPGLIADPASSAKQMASPKPLTTAAPASTSERKSLLTS